MSVLAPTQRALKSRPAVVRSAEFLSLKSMQMAGAFFWLSLRPLRRVRALTAAAALLLAGPALADEGTLFREAYAKFQARDYGGALALLQQLDAQADSAGKADAWNLRGSIHLRQRNFALARDCFRKAVALDSTLFAAKYNLAELEFRQGSYPASRSGFERILAGGVNDAAQAEFLRYKIALAWILEGRNVEARAAIARLEAANSPALFFANAALARQQKDAAAAASWLARAEKGTRPVERQIYIESFAALGWRADVAGAAAPVAPTPGPETVTAWTVAGMVQGTPAPTPAAVAALRVTPSPLPTGADGPRNEPPAATTTGAPAPAGRPAPLGSSLFGAPPGLGTPPARTLPDTEPQVVAGLRRAAAESAAPTAAPTPSEPRRIPASPTPAFLESYLAAAAKYQAREYPEAFALLDEADSLQRNQPDAANLRGLILLRQRDYEGAERCFRRASELDPSMWSAKFNVADVPFEYRNYSLARERLEKLYTETDAATQQREAELTQYKIFLTLLLEGKETMARNFMLRFNFGGVTPARYYAQAALNFHDGDFDKALNWMKTARTSYPPALDAIFAESLYRIGWLTENISQPDAAIAPDPSETGDRVRPFSTPATVPPSAFSEQAAVVAGPTDNPQPRAAAPAPAPPRK